MGAIHLAGTFGVDPVGRARIQATLIYAFLNSEEYDRAIQAAQQAAETFRTHGAHEELFAALGELGRMYIRLWRYDEALIALTDAIAVARQHGDADSLATWIGVLGDLHERAGDDDAALSAYREALASYSPQNPARISSSTAMARILTRLGEGRQARELLEKTLATTPTSLREHWAAVANQSGVQLTADGEPARALELQRKALDTVDGGRSPLTLFAVARELAATYRALGDLDEARVRLDRAIDRLASHRGRLQAQALRTSSSSTSRVYDEDAIALAMQMHARAQEAGHAGPAFELFERSRARSLADLLAEGRVDIRSGVGDALLNEQRALQQQLGQKDLALRQTRRDAAGTARAAVLEREIDDLSRALVVLDGRIRATSPRYAALRQPTALSLPEAQRLLDADTLLLAFSLGSHKSWGMGDHLDDDAQLRAAGGGADRGTGAEGVCEPDGASAARSRHGRGHGGDAARRHRRVAPRGCGRAERSRPRSDRIEPAGRMAHAPPCVVDDATRAGRARAEGAGDGFAPGARPRVDAGRERGGEDAGDRRAVDAARDRRRRRREVDSGGWSSRATRRGRSCSSRRRAPPSKRSTSPRAGRRWRAAR